VKNGNKEESEDPHSFAGHTPASVAKPAAQPNPDTSLPARSHAQLSPQPPPETTLPATSARPNTTFAALNVPLFRWLWAGSLCSFVSTQMQVIARGWLAHDLTGSNAALGGVLLGFGLPLLVFTPFGGVAADRFSKRLLIQISSITTASTAFALGFAVAFDFIQYWMLIGAAVAQGTVFSFMTPSRIAFTGELVGTKLLPNAVILQQMGMNGTRVFGPSLAGVLIGVPWVGTAGVYFCAGTFTLIALLMSFRLPPGHSLSRKKSGHVMQDLADGLQYMRRRPTLLLLAITSFAVVMTAFPYVAFLPALAKDIFDVGSSGYGLMSAASAIGALSASFFVARIAGGRHSRRIQSIAGTIFGLFVAVLGLVHTFPLSLLVVMCIGASTSTFQSLNNTIVLQQTDLEYHGRVQSLLLLSFSGYGMAALPLGAVGDAIGVQTTLTIMGSTTMVAMFAYILTHRYLSSRPTKEEAAFVIVASSRSSSQA